MKKNNPHTPILIREAMGTEPKVFTRYGASPERAKESSVEVGNSLLILKPDGIEYGKEKQESLIGMIKIRVDVENLYQRHQC